MLRRIFVAMFVFVVANTMMPASRAQEPYDEPWRPQFHFTPPKNFMNDPNGLVFYKGEYHLFYQYNPQGTEWGHMSWGHAVSFDTLHWKNLPLAIPEVEGEFMAYSGSAVVDWQNASGFCTSTDPKDRSCLVAIYTAAGKSAQKQHVAYSNDRGRTWTNYSGNPVADLGKNDFRDPKVFWYEPQKKWVMVAVLADERTLMILDSRDLKKWAVKSSFGPGRGEGQWECPDLFELPADGKSKDKKWVLVINRNPGAPAGGTGTKYFVGSFDGAKFTDENPGAKELWADYGKDFYATNSFSDIPASDGRRIWLGWISNWQYANKEPTAIWRGAQSLPRVLSLKSFSEGLRLVQVPVEETKALRVRQEMHSSSMSVAQANEKIRKAGVTGELLEIEAELAPGNMGETGFRLRKGNGEETLVGISATVKEVFIDRTHSGNVSFADTFPGRHSLVLQQASKIKLHIFVDRSTVEVFVNDGEIVLTDRIYPSSGSEGVEVYSDSGGGKVVSLSIWKLGSVWR